ncbi:MAG: hypothetical protein A4E73_02357 [Syntrophaceae bacterium PtaU1.Bin231]|nr:MAG: hypothetical protein A4E73_02357 [Syntrophaceae bacterium PtaU1.Bin231]
MNFAWVSRIRRRAGLAGFGITILLSAAILDGCYVYGPPPPPPAPAYYASTSFGRSWNAALDAMEDVGTRIVSADQNTGIIRGTRDGIDATITVRTQADGRVRVGFSSRGPSGQETGLTRQLYQAYERRMGRM